MQYDIEVFTKNLVSNNKVDLALYEDPQFCRQMHLYALEKIKFLLLDILRTRLSYEYKDNQEPFLSTGINKGINTVDHNGLNLLDYCTIAGLDDFGCMFAKLGCINALDTAPLSKLINPDFTNNNDPHLAPTINKPSKRINIDLKKYSDARSSGEGKTKPTLWKKIKHSIKNFPYNNHKFGILVLSFGLACMIAAPFTGGLSMVLLLTLGFPSILAGISSLQSAIESLNSYQQAEEGSRMANEIELLKIIHKDICDQVKIQLFKLDAEAEVYMKASSHLREAGSTSNLLLFSAKPKDKDKKPKTNVKKFRRRALML